MLPAMVPAHVERFRPFFINLRFANFGRSGAVNCRWPCSRFGVSSAGGNM